ncbi:hypothetical protein [uncultured Imperialibacter sp.]|uniref:hypothetical protein n=1 Tax=uncultured Imperialibacter sp. TaxID=1672639 RepID=UPI0030DD1A9D|tara:strand:- start:322 stop:1344 length:1023 start_codon:yes stop_codon:yes gene_type:complete
MTLCIAWIRQDKDGKELIFATDSCLTGGGEVWKHGIKLFELPRKDCLLCFAGETAKAYPLILNLVSSLKFDNKVMNQHTDLRQVLDYLCKNFSEVINSLDYELDAGDGYNPYDAARFIFGGWNWKLNLLEFWEIYYGNDEKKFLFKGYDSNNPRAYHLIGDHLPEAEEFLIEELTANGKRIQGSFDMEPFLVLSKMARDQQDFRSISGSLQVAKVYPSGSTEFFGVMWPSEKGKHTSLGRELNPYVKPQIRFLDPDTGVVFDLELPAQIAKLRPELVSTINDEDFGAELAFIEECYPNGAQKPDLTEKEKEMLLAIFKDNAYKKFLLALDEQPENVEDDE